MKIEEKVIACLYETSLFRGIDKPGIQNMINCLNPRIHYYKKNENIAMSGDPFHGIGIVIEGEAVIAKENIAGNRAILTVLKQGDMFGEMISFTEKKVWPVTVTAQSDSEVIFISPEKIITRCEKMCDSHQILIQNMLKIMSKKALILSRKVDYLSIRSLRGRLCAYLIEQWKLQETPVFSLPMNRDELADFFNVARPSISRELSKMKDEGYIDFHKSAFKIIDFEAMKKEI
ncbi:Crp/Fnr family transcriptional regulator [Fusibacter bizertensis]